jgi:hypothetical protein
VASPKEMRRRKDGWVSRGEGRGSGDVLIMQRGIKKNELAREDLHHHRKVDHRSGGILLAGLSAIIVVWNILSSVINVQELCYAENTVN